jgi:LCP family protein required for cell wall assembly
MKRLISFVGIIIVLVIGVVGFAANHLYDTSRELSEQIYDPSPIIHLVQINDQKLDQKQDVESSNNNQINGVQAAEKQVMLHQSFTILIMGVDRRAGDKGRSDVLIVATVNPKDSSTLIMNIPRDTRTTIAGMNREDKVNHSYAYGGTAMTIATVEKMISIPIDYYIKVDMEGFQQIIDTLGGVEVDNPLEFHYEGHDFPVGDLELKGEEALAYVRMRYDDPRGDLGRNERQKLVIKAVINHLLRIQSVFKLNKIANSIEGHVKTNLTFDEWKKMGVQYREALDHVQTEKLNGYGQIIDGIYYYIVNDKERQRITESLQLQLNSQKTSR